MVSQFAADISHGPAESKTVEAGLAQTAMQERTESRQALQETQRALSAFRRAINELDESGGDTARPLRRAFVSEISQFKNSPLAADLLIAEFLKPANLAALGSRWHSDYAVTQLYRDSFVAVAAGKCLRDSTYGRAQQAFKLKEIFDGYDSEKYSPEEYKQQLRPFVHDPVFVDYIVDRIMTARCGLYGAALALRETPLPEKQEDFRKLILSACAQAARGNDDALIPVRTLPYALDPALPDTKKVLLEGLRIYEPISRHGFFESAVVTALAAVPDQEGVEEQILERFFKKHPDDFYQSLDSIRRAASEYFAAHPSPASEEAMRSLVEGGKLRTASEFATRAGYTGLRWLREVAQLVLSRYQFELNDIREAAELALQKTEKQEKAAQ